MGITLTKRLAQIDSMVTPGYAHIWDCCCDHGLLGARLLSRRVAGCIHFVDQVPGLMRELEAKLQRFFPLAPEPSLSPWQVHCIDAAAVPLQQHDGMHLVIIAGVGGELMLQLVTAIHNNHAGAHIDFLLCPVQHPFALREQLIRLDFSLRQEALVEENRRFYEILLVSNRSASRPNGTRISAVGAHIWHASSDAHRKTASSYLEKTLNHYHRVQHGKGADVRHIIQAYQGVTITACANRPGNSDGHLPGI